MTSCFSFQDIEGIELFRLLNNAGTKDSYWQYAGGEMVEDLLGLDGNYFTKDTYKTALAYKKLQDRTKVIKLSPAIVSEVDEDNIKRYSLSNEVFANEEEARKYFSMYNTVTYETLFTLVKIEAVVPK